MPDPSWAACASLRPDEHERDQRIVLRLGADRVSVTAESQALSRHRWRSASRPRSFASRLRGDSIPRSKREPTGPQWAYEIKHDGFRFLAGRHRKQVRVYSRGGHDWGERLPAITKALLARADEVIE